MNCLLKKLDQQSILKEKTDLLLMLVTEEMLDAKTAKTGNSCLQLAQSAKADKHWDTQAGTVLNLYAPAGVSSKCVLIVGAGKGSVRDIRKAIASGLNAAKFEKPYEAIVLLPDSSQQSASVVAAAMAAADSTYVYVTTKSSPKPRRLSKLTLGVADVTALKPKV
jgi:leucyl aminopeptidase